MIKIYKEMENFNSFIYLKTTLFLIKQVKNFKLVTSFT